MDVNKYNLIYSDEDIIGFVKDILKYFEEYSQYLKNMLNEENDDGIECELEIVNDFIDYVSKHSKALYDDTLIKVFYNPMGSYQYKILVEMD